MALTEPHKRKVSFSTPAIRQNANKHTDARKGTPWDQTGGQPNVWRTSNSQTCQLPFFLFSTQRELQYFQREDPCEMESHGFRVMSVWHRAINWHTSFGTGVWSEGLPTSETERCSDTPLRAGRVVTSVGDERATAQLRCPHYKAGLMFKHTSVLNW
jgi:hypothetical protein